ncbi:hypothetical protein CAP35_13250 [Chitinophagaceae bacterium IBVUCB1]|nr:hypothetical protein CAP35_13250 [Chitinophagaceae bacterium IBVUCB1]
MSIAISTNDTATTNHDITVYFAIVFSIPILKHVNMQPATSGLQVLGVTTALQWRYKSVTICVTAHKWLVVN